MQTIIITATNQLWEAAQKAGTYTQSTVEETLSEAGFIHATNPDQTVDMLNRRYRNHDNIILLFVELAKVKSAVKFEASSGGKTPGLFPHIYGPLNIDAVYDTTIPVKDALGEFAEDVRLAELVA